MQRGCRQQLRSDLLAASIVMRWWPRRRRSGWPSTRSRLAQGGRRFVMGARSADMHYTGKWPRPSSRRRPGARLTAASAISSYGLAFGMPPPASHLRPGIRRGARRPPLHRPTRARIDRAPEDRGRAQGSEQEPACGDGQAVDGQRLGDHRPDRGDGGHELSNPLASIRNSMELVRQQTEGKGRHVERGSTASIAIPSAAPASSRTCSISHRKKS